MRIATSDVVLSSEQIAVSISTREEYLRKWNDNSDVTKHSFLQVLTAAEKTTAIKETSIGSQPPAPSTRQSQSPQAFPPKDAPDKLPCTLSELKARLIRKIMEIFTGIIIDTFNPDNHTHSVKRNTSAVPKDEAESSAQSQKQGWGFDYYLKKISYSKTGTSFSAFGTVTTADGKTLDFSASLEISREHSIEDTTTIKAGGARIDPTGVGLYRSGLEIHREHYEKNTLSIRGGGTRIDPLIINLNGAGVGFSSATFTFDLNADGSQERIHAPAEGSGFLACDENGNGRIDDGSELFGPTCGNGFAELAALDSDKNGWIDENDPLFEKLSIWQKSAYGSDTLMNLRDTGIGALNTKGVPTLFELTSTAAGKENDAATLKETSVFLRENGTAGLIQEVDMAT